MGEPAAPPRSSGCRDSNSGPLRPERSALPGCATPRARERVAIIAPVAQRDEIIRYANELLEVDRFPEYGTPGLQVLGADEVTKIACGVSSSTRALRARGRGGRAARDRPPRHVLAERAGLDRPAPAWPARDALRRRPQPGGVPPRARRASGARQQRAARRRARASTVERCAFGEVGAGWPPARAVGHRRARRAASARRRRPRAARLRARPGADPAGRDLLGRRRPAS